jgi:hypothetical protein
VNRRARLAAEGDGPSAAGEEPPPSNRFPLTLLRRAGFFNVGLVLLVLAFNAYYLLPELTVPAPNINDDAFHYMNVVRADQALSDGENIVDHWSPTLDLGAPRFLLYQHLPYISVVLLGRLLLQQVSLLTLFNLTRYLLMVGLPLTVFWTARQLGLSTRASAFAAAASPLLSGFFRYGFEYDSYVFRGFGVYTQLWAMHLSFISLGCLYRLVNKGTGYTLTVAACSALVLSHLLYSLMMLPTALVVLLAGLNRSNAPARIKRLGIAAVATGAITSYFWIPFFLNKQYFGASPYEDPTHFNSFGVKTIMNWLVQGELLDHGRLPILTVLLAIGILSALAARTRPALLLVVLFVVWLAFYFGNQVWGPVTDSLSIGDMILFSRFIGGVDMAAILLIGLGGEAVWKAIARLPEIARAKRLPERLRATTSKLVGRLPQRAPAALAGVVLLVLLVPAMNERRDFYQQNTEWLQQTHDALASDADAHTILASLAQQPPGRAYAGMRDNWGQNLNFGLTFNSVRFRDLFPFYGIPALSPPYQELTLNSSVQFFFNYQSAAQYDLFNVKYVIAPAAQPMPAFLTPITTTSRYILYRAPTSGYSEFAASTVPGSASSKYDLLYKNRDWLASDGPAARRFIRWDYPADSVPAPVTTPGCADGGTVNYERWQSSQLDLTVQCKQAATLVLKMTYNPNWKVEVDGQEQATFMVSPSFIGVELPAGQHFIHAEYRSQPLKTYLLIFGLLALALIGLAEWRRKQLASLGGRLATSLRGRLGRSPQ